MRREDFQSTPQASSNWDRLDVKRILTTAEEPPIGDAVPCFNSDQTPVNYSEVMRGNSVRR